jgi:hypothetical protein
MKLEDVTPHAEYLHRIWGRVLHIGCHPHDGAHLIVERQETIDPDDDDHVLGYCEASDLTPAEGSLWPYLGFTLKERSALQSREWGARHGFAEVPEGSGRWQYPNGTPVPFDVWCMTWRADYLPQEAP